ncbi:maltose acetyltransferase domain-containing protein, partial [Virgibacillus salexigens]|uniref:maltose acetyltransferase domain-containing protein n=1 Tax=Virgibacillus salexigens TaxID=61016 RepID=UPI0030818713
MWRDDMKTEKEKMVDGELYNPPDQTLVNDRRTSRRKTRLYNQSLEMEGTDREVLLNDLFGS